MVDTTMTETPDYDKSAIPLSHHATHEDGGADEIDALSLIFPSSFRSYLSAVQSIISNSTTRINFDLLSFNKGNDFSTITHRYTAPKDGTYLFVFSPVIVSLADTKDFKSYIRKNGADVFSSFFSSGGVAYFSITSSIPLQLSQNDYIEFFVFHNHGTNRNIRHLPLNTNVYGLTLY